MIRLAPTDSSLFDALRGRCGVETLRDRSTWWCSRSCEALGEHVLLDPSTSTTTAAPVAIPPTKERK